MRCVRLPRGAAWISISLSSGSASFASRTSHSPPPNSVWNTVRKFSRTLPNDSRNSALAVWSISRAACCNEWRAAQRSSACVIRTPSRFVSSACSSTASAFTGPTASIAARSRSFSWRSHSRSPATSGASASSWSSGLRHPAPTRPPPRVAPPPPPLVLRAHPLQVPRHFGSVGEQLVERLAPLGLDLRHETAPAAEHLGPLQLELVVYRI